ncbi:MAG: MarR family transcriptional regulator, partial [Caldilineaceae bacterium]|nr:MarR family transcriptional regulator [Caldilinea sp.]MCB0148925.1 MarR family transcriptional regulator [Caldilineaceae bacterium]HRW49951.1 MarR family transcriptional regulator [Caldilinea sp.]
MADSNPIPGIPDPPPEPETIDYLLAQVCRLHRERAGTILEAVGLFRGQPPVLMRLHEADGQTQGDLAARLRVAPATMTKMIQRMERAGFVQRRPDAADQRISRVYLTDAGRAVRAEMMGALGTLEAETFAGLDNEERAQLRGFLERLRANLRGVVDESME